MHESNVAAAVSITNVDRRVIAMLRVAISGITFILMFYVLTKAHHRRLRRSLKRTFCCCCNRHQSSSSSAELNQNPLVDDALEETRGDDLLTPSNSSLLPSFTDLYADHSELLREDDDDDCDDGVDAPSKHIVSEVKYDTVRPSSRALNQPSTVAIDSRYALF